MKIDVRKIIAISIVMIMIMSLSACRNNIEKQADAEIKIVTTLFPYYDFARAIIGDVEGVSLTMTVAPGQDSHSFEPAPKDIIKMEEADLFIYNGGSLEHWVDTVLDSFGEEKHVMRMMDYVEVMEEETVEGMDLRFEESHNHEEEHNHEEADHQENHEYDEHIWTSPVNAIFMVSYICDEICKIDPQNEEKYRKNAQTYIDEIKNVDEDIRNVVEGMEKKEIIVADKFPLLYFAKEYGLAYYAAFPGCGSDMEPSAKTIAFLIDKVKEDQIGAVFYLELSSHTVANAISEDTGAKAMQFNSCHNITQKQFDDGVTYVDLMRENVNNLRRSER